MRNLAVNSAFASARQEQNQASRPLKPSGVPWLGDIPVGWGVSKVKSEFVSRKTIAGKAAPNYQRLALTMQGVVQRSKEDANGLQPEQFEGYQILEENELVFKLIDLQNIPTSRVGRSPFTGLVSPAYIVLHHRFDKSTRYAEYYFLSMWLNQIFNQLGGDAVRSCIGQNDLLNLPYLHIDETEQRAIADFLDEKCAAIDAIVEEAKSGIEEYAKWKQSVVFQAVTKGLDPHAKMKDSGVEWIGEIPEEWKVTPLRFLTDSYKAGPFGSALITDQLQKTGTILVYTPEHIAKREAELPNNLYLPEERREEMSQFFVKAGDVVFPIVGSLGRALQVTTSMPEGIINQRLAKFRLRPDRIDANYFMWLFAKSEFFKQHIEVVCRGSIIVNLTKGIVGDMPIPLPTLPEQRAIAAYLDEKCSAIDALIEEKKQLIEDLGVYKKSLIYETVTGKRKIA